jgi:hypothetical protein
MGELMKRFEKKPEIEEAAARVYAAASDFVRGDTLSYQWILAKGGYHRMQPEWTTFVKYLRKMFRDNRGITLWCPVANSGLKLATADEQILLLNDKRQRKAMRQLGKAVDALTVIRSEELDLQQQTTRWSRVERNKRSLREIRRNRKLDKLLG